MPPARRLADAPAAIPGAAASGRVLEDVAPACDGVAALADTAAAVASAGGGCDVRDVELEKCDSMQDATCASRAVCEPSAPLGGRAQ